MAKAREKCAPPGPKYPKELLIEDEIIQNDRLILKIHRDGTEDIAVEKIVIKHHDPLIIMGDEELIMWTLYLAEEILEDVAKTEYLIKADRITIAGRIYLDDEEYPVEITIISNMQ